MAEEWIAAAAEKVAAHAQREIEALVAVSSPSGDVSGAEEACALVAALLPDEVAVQRPDCSSPDHAPDLLARLTGTGERRLLLLGHLDTVISHDDHRSAEHAGDRLLAPGAIDMKGGVALALGVLRALAGIPERFAEVALLLVNDEEWRTHEFAHAERFAGFDACLCFEGAARVDGEEAVIVRRKAAGTLRVAATGVSAHSGSAPDRGRNALLALSAAADRIAAVHDPDGPDHLTAVPTVIHAGEAFNIVPASGELFCDLRAARLEAFERVLASLPEEVGGAVLQAEFVRRWPGMDSRESTEATLARATGLLGRPIVGSARGGASDASHFAVHIPITIDGLGPHGGGAHTPNEYVELDSIRPRAELALAIAAALLGFD